MGNTPEVPKTIFLRILFHKYLIVLEIEYAYSKVTTHGIKQLLKSYKIQKIQKKKIRISDLQRPVVKVTWNNLLRSC